MTLQFSLVNVAPLIVAGAAPANISTWSMLSGYKCNQTIGANQSSLVSAQKACADDQQCSGIYDASCDGHAGFLLCNASGTVKRLRGGCVHELLVRVYDAGVTTIVPHVATARSN